MAATGNGDFSRNLYVHSTKFYQNPFRGSRIAVIRKTETVTALMPTWQKAHFFLNRPSAKTQYVSHENLFAGRKSHSNRDKTTDGIPVSTHVQRTVFRSNGSSSILAQQNALDRTCPVCYSSLGNEEEMIGNENHKIFGTQLHYTNSNCTVRFTYLETCGARKWGKKKGNAGAGYDASRLRLKCDGTRAETNFVFLRNGRGHLNRLGRQFSRPLAAEVCASAVVMLDIACSEVA